MILELVEAELQSDMARRGSPTEQLGVITTALLVLNLAAITGVSDLNLPIIVKLTRHQQTSQRMAQVEMLYVNLIAVRA